MNLIKKKQEIIEMKQKKIIKNEVWTLILKLQSNESVNTVYKQKKMKPTIINLSGLIYFLHFYIFVGSGEFLEINVQNQVWNYSFARGDLCSPIKMFRLLWMRLIFTK